MGIAKDKLTDDMKREIERLRQFVSRNRFEVRMNSTKWRAAIDAVAAVEGYAPLHRIRLVTDNQEPPAGAWAAGFPAGLPLYNAIEWVELHPRGAGPDGAPPRADRAEDLRAALAGAGVPVEVTATGVRIVGHARPADRGKG